jgi:protein TonB
MHRTVSAPRGRRAGLAFASASILWIATVRPVAAQEPAAPMDSTRQLAAVETMPRLSNRRDVNRQVERSYPPALRRERVSGLVTLRFRIQATGVVDSTSITVENSTDPAFEAPARSVVQAMRFEPATVRAKPVAVWVVLPVSYTPDPPRVSRNP